MLDSYLPPTTGRGPPSDPACRAPPVGGHDPLPARASRGACRARHRRSWPLLEGGNFAMRVTNAGIIGNAFFDVGLSSDPSFEFPRYSGQECVNSAELWVGAVDENGERRVSGGPMLEWRPTPDADDRVRPAWHGRLGSLRFVDDDGDGQVDEEILNGKDDDGDGEVDEDLGFDCQQLLAADYVDDRPEAVNYIYEGGEQH